MTPTEMFWGGKNILSTNKTKTESLSCIHSKNLL